MPPGTPNETGGGVREPYRLLDLFCCAGGAARGYQRAGFWVQGVDIEPQPRYIGDAFGEADVLGLDPAWIAANFDAVHASPPCQVHSNTARLNGAPSHSDLIPQTRALLRAAALPYVIENVEGAPLIAPIMLCGAMFCGLRTYRHRLFECSFEASAPRHPGHEAQTAKMGRPASGLFVHAVGHFPDVNYVREAMGIDWPAKREEIAQAIPPAYTEFLGHQLMREAVRRRETLRAPQAASDKSREAA